MSNLLSIWAVYDKDEFIIAYPRKIMCKVYVSNYSDTTNLTIKELIVKEQEK